MTTKFKRITIEGKRVIYWRVFHRRKMVAGGLCANLPDARNDANIWIQDHATTNR